MKGWLNTPPLDMEALRGKVILLDFWTYSCVNCIRTLPHMKDLHMRFSETDFVLVAVHTPEFAFEKVPENVSDAVRRFGIHYPVAIDSDNVTWKLYGNQYWPRQTLIDHLGRVRWEHAGEGDYDKLEENIRTLLREAGKTVPNSQAETPKSLRKKSGLFGSPAPTPEIYAGSLRSKGYGNGQVCVPGSCTRFIDPEKHERDIVYLDGDWTQSPEYVVHASKDRGHVVLRFSARNANAVLGALNGRPGRVKVELDGKPLAKDRAGSDVQWESEEAFLMVKEHRLYDVVRMKNVETHELKLVTMDDDLCLYAYTFG